MVSIPASSSGFSNSSDPTILILACMSCHDGNVANVGMMKGASVETPPVVVGHAPKFLGNDCSAPGNYGNDHPVGPAATFGCGGSHNGDCAVFELTVRMRRATGIRPRNSAATATRINPMRCTAS
jgi:hypothetical protein